MQSHDINRPEVQSYIENELRPWSNGDPRFTDVRPSFFGADKSCSYFPVSNIPAQGNNRSKGVESRNCRLTDRSRVSAAAPLVFFFIYHIGICKIGRVGVSRILNRCDFQVSSQSG